MDKKTCTTCGIGKDVAAFYKMATGKFGREARCKECRDTSSALYRAENRDAYNAYHREDMRRRRQGKQA